MLTAVADEDSFLWLTCLVSKIVHLLQSLERCSRVRYLTDDAMMVVEVGSWHKCDEELRVLRVFAVIGHGNDALNIVLVWERLV